MGHSRLLESCTPPHHRHHHHRACKCHQCCPPKHESCEPQHRKPKSCDD